MDNERVILHSDMNSFYASVEMMLNPELKGKPVAVCGSTEERHGIVLAKSDLAKKAGVKTGMVNWEARQLCPGLVVVPPQYDQYLKYSKLARQIYHRYTDLVEPYGMDECWLDVTGWCRRVRCRRADGRSCSAGRRWCGRTPCAAATTPTSCCCASCGSGWQRRRARCGGRYTAGRDSGTGTTA